MGEPLTAVTEYVWLPKQGVAGPVMAGSVPGVPFCTFTLTELEVVPQPFEAVTETVYGPPLVVQLTVIEVEF